MYELDAPAALARPLAEFGGWRLHIDCPSCRLLVQLSCDGLAGTLPGRTLGDVVARLACSRCGGKPASVTLTDGAEGAGQAGRQAVRLLPAE